MSAAVLRQLDELVERSEITGYTFEPEPAYLTSPLPTLTYSMYDSTLAALRNLHAFAADVSTFGANIATHPTRGTVAERAGSGIRIRRSTQLTLRVTFTSAARLVDGVRLVSRSYLAGNGATARPASWRVPDVRIAGVSAIDGAIPAFAHAAGVDGGAAVVLTLCSRPPLHGMTSHPVRLLPVWRHYLGVC